MSRAFSGVGLNIRFQIRFLLRAPPAQRQVHARDVHHVVVAPRRERPAHGRAQARPRGGTVPGRLVVQAQVQVRVEAVVPRVVARAPRRRRYMGERPAAVRSCAVPLW